MLLRITMLSLVLLLIGCEDKEADNNIVDPLVEDPIISRIIITVEDSTLAPTQVYYDSFSISFPENFIDISENILTLQIDPPQQNVAGYEISVEPPVHHTKALCWSRLPQLDYWHFRRLQSYWQILPTQYTHEWTGIALFGYTIEEFESTDTLSLNLSLNGTIIFSDSTIIITYHPLDNAIHKSVPGTEHSFQSSQRMQFLDSKFKTNIAWDYRDPRNIHNFIIVHQPGSIAAAWVSGNGYGYTNSAHETDAYFFFASLPE